jgi:hypothetical protein
MRSGLHYPALLMKNQHPTIIETIQPIKNNHQAFINKDLECICFFILKVFLKKIIFLFFIYFKIIYFFVISDILKC